MTGCAAFLLAVSALTAGWENVCGERTWPEVTNRIWCANYAEGADGFSVERRDGAEGEVEFLPDGIRIRKTNGTTIPAVIAAKSANTHQLNGHFTRQSRVGSSSHSSHRGGNAATSASISSYPARYAHPIGNPTRIAARSR